MVGPWCFLVLGAALGPRGAGALVATNGETCVSLRLEPPPSTLEGRQRAYTIVDVRTRATLETGRFEDGAKVVCLDEDALYRIQLDAGCASSVAVRCVEPTPTPTTAAPSTAAPSAVPSHVPTTAAPSPAPTVDCLNLPQPRICWDQPGGPLANAPTIAPGVARTVEPFDCETHSNPIQVLRLSDGAGDFVATYSVVELDMLTGTYTLIHVLDYYDGKVNGVGLLDGGADGYFAMGAFDRKLCRFDAVQRICFEADLFYDGPNVGVLVGTTYYYASNPGNDPGSSFYFVTEVHSDAPVFVASAEFVINSDLYAGAVLDVTSIEETGVGDDLVIDGSRRTAYLLGLAEDSRLLVVRLDPLTGFPEAYAVLNSEYTDEDAAGGSTTTVFGAAFAYLAAPGSTNVGAAVRVLFASNDGLGLFGLDLPLTIDAACWNRGPAVANHALCASDTAMLTRLVPTTVTAFNDGMNCPYNRGAAYIFQTAEPTAVPTAAPSSSAPTARPTPPPLVFWADESVQPFDCDAEPYSLQTVGTAANAYTLFAATVESDGNPTKRLFSLAYYRGALDGLAMLTVSPLESYLLGAFGHDLCRFDATRAVCWTSGSLRTTTTEVGAKKRAAATLGMTYYYADGLGEEGGSSIHSVTGLETDAAIFSSSSGGSSSSSSSLVAAFAVSASLLGNRPVLDFASMSENSVGATLVDDGVARSRYLVGVTAARKVFVARVPRQTVVPDAYAVLEADVRWGDRAAFDGELNFGSAFAYDDPFVDGGYRVFFANDDGYGVFELQLKGGGLKIPAACWNTGADVATHVACADATAFVSTATLLRQTASGVVTKNDGANCLYAPGFLWPEATAVPTVAPTCGGICWADAGVDPFDCTRFSQPLQILRFNAADAFYSLQMLDRETGNYVEVVAALDFTTEKINGAAMYAPGASGFSDVSSDLFYMVAAMGSELCRFDFEKRVCFGGRLAETDANAGTIVGNGYYYAKSPGRDEGTTFHAVLKINTDAPEFYDMSTVLQLSSTLYLGAVLDVAPLEDTEETDYVVDGVRTGYAIGLGLDSRVLIVRLDPATKLPTAYAVLPSVVDGATPTLGLGFGAAYTYENPDAPGEPLVAFASNGGEGIFSLGLPVTVPAVCWNTGVVAAAHLLCSEVTAQLSFIIPAVAATSNDGLNCPRLVLFDPTPAPVAPTSTPTIAPCPTFKATDAEADKFVCWLNTAVTPFDCATNGAPVQVGRFDAAEDFVVLLADDGREGYEEVYTLAFAEATSVNAVGLLDAGAAGFFVFGAVDSALCRFDAATAICFADALEYDQPNVGAIIGPDYYYSKNPGKRNARRTFFTVLDVHSDVPVFDATERFVIDPQLFGATEQLVLDVAPFFERSSAEVVVDGTTRNYLIGLANNFDVLVVRIGADRVPEAYAILKNPLVNYGNATALVDDDDLEAAEARFGAAFAYVGSEVDSVPDAPRAIFASNVGLGVFELLLPLFVPAACWNRGDPLAADATTRATHAACDAGYTPTVTFRGPSTVIKDNDGLSCPYHPADLFDECVGRLCWDDETVEAFDCDRYPAPLEVAREGTVVQVAAVLEEDATVEGSPFFLDPLFDLDYEAATVTVDAVAMVHAAASSEDYYLVGAFDGVLCRFDNSKKLCFPETLLEGSPTAGAVIGTTYYYATSPGAAASANEFYRVERIHTDHPVARTVALITLDPALFVGPVGDVAALTERAGFDDLVVDGVAGASYLLGLGEGWELLVVRLLDDGVPAAYAVLDADVDGADGGFLPQGPWGAAFAYVSATTASARVLFAANEGFGVAEVDVPFLIPATCWNEGVDYGHRKCGSRKATLTVRAQPTQRGLSGGGVDGANCPSLERFERFDTPTPAPTLPCDAGNFNDRVCWKAPLVDAWDAARDGPARSVSRTSATRSPVRHVDDLATGTTLFTMASFAAPGVNAMGLLDGGADGYFPMGAVGNKLCRFDARGLVCFVEALAYAAPDSGAILYSTYYYTDSREDAILAVTDVDTDVPVFVRDAALRFRPGLLASRVRDLAPVTFETDAVPKPTTMPTRFDSPRPTLKPTTRPTARAVTVVDDGATAAYLVGLSGAYELLVVRIPRPNTMPDAYAVLSTTVDWGGHPEAFSDASFGAAYAYAGDATAANNPRIFFASDAEDHGVFEVLLPLAIPAECWNRGAVVATHVSCASGSAASVARVANVTAPPLSIIVGPPPSEQEQDTVQYDGFNYPTYSGARLFPEACPFDDVCWADRSIAPFDCDAQPNPIQVLRTINAAGVLSTYYSVYVVDLTGANVQLGVLDWFEGRLNAVGMLSTAQGGEFFFGAFGLRLCRFDFEARVCFRSSLRVAAANVGDTIGTTFYYTRSLGGSPGDAIYYVTDIHTDYPTFDHGDPAFEVDPDLFIGAILDFAGFSENGADDLVLDDDVTSYLVGLGPDAEVLIAKIDPSGRTAAPVAYAVLATSLTGTEEYVFANGFGAAYAYSSETSSRVFFSSNDGSGFFELELPIDVPADCWNVGAFGHEVCPTVATLAYNSPAVGRTQNNDGANCPSLDALLEEIATPVPTVVPSASCLSLDFPHVCWANRAVEPFDCASQSRPVELRTDAADDGGAPWYLVPVDKAYVGDDVPLQVEHTTPPLFALSSTAAVVIDGVALYDGGADGLYGMGAFGDQLCRFDAAQRICFTQKLTTPTGRVRAAAVVGAAYYYTHATEGPVDVRWVDAINGDAPVFVTATLVTLSRALVPWTIGDLAALTEGEDQVIVQDGAPFTSYLFALGGTGYDLVIVRLGEEGAPEAYAVLDSEVDWAGAEPSGAPSDGFVFAAFAYAGDLSDDLRPRLLFSADAVGVLEVLLPVVVPAACWNTGLVVGDDAAHAKCATGVDATVVRRQVPPAEGTDEMVATTVAADGLNCPYYDGLDLFSAGCETICWEDMAVEPFDCETYTSPLLIARLAGASTLTLREHAFFDDASGAFLKFDELAAGTTVDGVALGGPGPGAYYLFGVFDGDQLCRFDADLRVCFDAGNTAAMTTLVAPVELGALVGSTYYYAAVMTAGAVIHFVTDVTSDYPTFSTDPAEFTVGDGVLDGAVGDMAGLVESSMENAVDDGDAGASYLVGLSSELELFVVRLDPDSKAPFAYAVLDAKPIPGLNTTVAATTTFAAYSFHSEQDDGTMDRYVAFSSNAGLGMLRLALPVAVPAACWNSGLFEHTKCATATATLTVDRPAAALNVAAADGFNCPSYDALFRVTSAPTAAPTVSCANDPTPRACWVNRAVQPFDCEAHSGPLQVMRYLNEDTGLFDGVYYVRELDTIAGTYSDVHDLAYTTVFKVNGVALYDAGADGFYAFAAIGEQLCRFDSAQRRCFAPVLAYPTANVGTIVGNRYYYSYAVGKNTKSFYWVDRIHTDTPIFHSADAILAIPPGLFKNSVLDVAALSETADEVVDDGLNGHSYLFGLGQHFEVLVVRLSAATGFPEAYAVLESFVDWTDFAGTPPTVDDVFFRKFGAAFAFSGDWRGASARLMFAANGGGGVFEVALPVAVPPTCWNTGLDTSDDRACALGAVANVVYRGPSDVAAENDGFNCPYFEGVDLFEPPCDAPCWDDATVGRFNCALFPGFVHTVRASTTTMVIAEFDVVSFAAEAIDFFVDAGDEPLFAAAALLYADATDEAYLFAAFGGTDLCRVDVGGARVCFSGDLVESATIGAILGTTYYYADFQPEGSSSPTRIYAAEQLQTDYPQFAATSGLAIPSGRGLYAREGLLDLTALATGALINDGVADAAYLLGLGQGGELFVVRLVEGEAVAYTVVETVITGWTGDVAAATAAGNASVAAAHTFTSPATGSTAIFFALAPKNATGVDDNNNNNNAVFELALPLTVPATCWNFGTVTAEHFKCAPSRAQAVLDYVGPSAVGGAVHGGFNCPSLGALRGETLAPTPQPTFDCAADPESRICWGDPRVGPFDCKAHSGPIQVLRASTTTAGGVLADRYTAREFDFLDGSYAALYAINFIAVGTKVNALALLDGGGDGDGASYYTMAAIADKLCRLDTAAQAVAPVCFAESFVYDSPNVGAILGTRYYYSYSIGKNSKSVYWVDDIHTDTPIFVRDARVVVSSTLFTAAVTDVAALYEQSEDDGRIVETASPGTGYLFGLGRRFELVVFKVDADGYPAAYAVLATTMSAATDDAFFEAEGDASGFGAAFAYVGDLSDPTDPRVFFASNAGYGFYELELPIEVPAACWNTGIETASHAACLNVVETLTYRAPSVMTTLNDGFNCPVYNGAELFVTTCDADAVCWADDSVGRVDCGTAPGPFQVSRILDTATQTLTAAPGLYTVDLATGALGAVAGFFASPGGASSSSLDAVAFFDGVMIGVFDGDALCRFDAASTKVCYEKRRSFGDQLRVAGPTVGAVAKTSFYYGKSPGSVAATAARSIYAVHGIHTDDPTFSTVTPNFEILPRLLGGRAVKDLATLPRGVAFVQAGVFAETGAYEYLVGLGHSFEVLIVRLERDTENPEPEVYAVLAADTRDFVGDGVAIPTTTDLGFGAAFSYVDATDPTAARLLFWANDAGLGLFELQQPLQIPDACWNSGTSTFSKPHGACAAERAVVTRVAPSSSAFATRFNDGLNCPTLPGPAFASLYATAAPTLAPTGLPTPVPLCEDYLPLRACWAEALVATYPEPLLRGRPAVLVENATADGSNYYLAELDRDSVTPVWPGLTFAMVTLDAIVLLNTTAGAYALGNVDGLLCRFDTVDATCFATALRYPEANVGVLVGASYYYSFKPGRNEKSFFVVHRVNSDAPVFSEAPVRLKMAANLFEGELEDAAAVTEAVGADDVVVDDLAAAAYVVMMGAAFEVVLVRLSVLDGEAEAYAVLPSVVSWQGNEASTDFQVFGAAVSFAVPGSSSAPPQVLFAANSGDGIFEVAFPLTVPAECWNTGFDTGSHALCSAAATVVWRSKSFGAAVVRDSMTFPSSPKRLFTPTAAPTAVPTTLTPTTLNASQNGTLGGGRRRRLDDGVVVAPTPRPSAKPSFEPTVGFDTRPCYRSYLIRLGSSCGVADNVVTASGGLVFSGLTIWLCTDGFLGIVRVSLATLLGLDEEDIIEMYCGTSGDARRLQQATTTNAGLVVYFQTRFAAGYALTDGNITAAIFADDAAALGLAMQRLLARRIRSGTMTEVLLANAPAGALRSLYVVECSAGGSRATLDVEASCGVVTFAPTFSPTPNRTKDGDHTFWHRLVKHGWKFTPLFILVYVALLCCIVACCALLCFLLLCGCRRREDDDDEDEDEDDTYKVAPRLESPLAKKFDTVPFFVEDSKEAASQLQEENNSPKRRDDVNRILENFRNEMEALEHTSVEHGAPHRIRGDAYGGGDYVPAPPHHVFPPLPGSARHFRTAQEAGFAPSPARSPMMMMPPPSTHRSPGVHQGAIWLNVPPQQHQGGHHLATSSQTDWATPRASSPRRHHRDETPVLYLGDDDDDDDSNADGPFGYTGRKRNDDCANYYENPPSNMTTRSHFHI